MFQLIDNDTVCCFDVDETLILDTTRDENDTESREVLILDPYDGTTWNYRVVHEKHVALLKQMHMRGRHIVVWSGSGALWARSVIEALELEKYVHLILTKPIGYVDDLPCEVWLNNRIYIGGSK